MKKKIKLEPQEFVAVIVEAISSACLTVAGVPDEQATLIGTTLGAITKGISVSNRSSSESLLSSLEESVISALDSDSFELPPSCKELLRNDLLSSRKIIEFMCQPDSNEILKKHILNTCKQDPDCDVDTFPIDEILSTITAKFENEVLNNHELATYASYCLLRSRARSSKVYLANQQYIDSIKEPLFLHKSMEGTRVNLENLFVLQNYKIINTYGKIGANPDDSPQNLLDVIADFLQNNEKSFFFIEGDAGSGKTTLIAWINYHYSLGNKLAFQLFGSRPLLTIRLRDLEKKDISDRGGLSAAILRYMKIDSLDDLERMFPKAVMILDGFDELCMIEGANLKHERLLYDLWNKELKGFQFIVTTRPKFISSGINLPSDFISLKHFDSEQRSIWLDRYTSEKYCAQVVDEQVYAYIKGIDDDTTSCICDTPMTLYMLVAKKGSSEFLNNSWALYHHIFFEELSKTEYNKMFPDPNRKYSHDISVLQDVLYRISEEIAFRMYQSGNQSFFLSERELSSIIDELSSQMPVLKNANIQDIAARCYALCCYWKANSDRGVVEFLHNNIRDFFLAEKIYREMNGITQQIQDKKNGGLCKQLLINKLCSLFHYGVLETKVTEFILLRAIYDAQKGIIDFAQYEYQNRMVASVVFGISRGIVDSGVLSENFSINPVQKATNILTCIVQVFRYAYEAYLNKSDLIYWLSESPAQNNMLTTLFKPVFCQVPVTITSDYMISLGSRGYFCGINLKGCDLRNIDFQFSQIKSALLSDSVLCGCDFSHAILDGSDLTNADIHYASLKNASLICCNLTGADLRGTELPDGFVSFNQDEQIEHLKSLKIDGLVV
mgnify:CR=1 FL=1